MRYIKVSLYFQKKGKQLYIVITDDGQGFDEKIINLGKGFTNMKTRINEINGKLKIKSQKNKGTSIEVHLAII